jgi:hypothetical protein
MSLLVAPIYDGSSQLDGDVNPTVGNVDSSTSSSSVGQICVFNSTTGKLITNSLATVSGNLLSSAQIQSTSSFFARNLAETQPRFTLSNNGDFLFSDGTNTANLRLRKNGVAATLLIDNGSSGAASIQAQNGNLNGFQSLTSNLNLTLSSIDANGTINLTSTGTGNINLNSTGTGNIVCDRPLTTTSGDLSINPFGSNVNFNSKNITTVSSIQTAVINSTANLSINPSGGSILFNSKLLTQINQVNMGTNLTALGQMKIRLYDDGGANLYGFSMLTGGGVLTYEVPSTGNHIFYSNSIERMRISGTAVSVSVPITTQTGDLSLNPVGSNINCNSKNLINAILSNPTLTPSSQTLNLSATNFTGTLTLNCRRVGDLVTIRLSGSVQATASILSFATSASVIPAEFLPTNISRTIVNADSFVLCFADIVNTGQLIILKQNGATNFTINEFLAFNNGNPTFTFWRT